MQFVNANAYAEEEDSLKLQYPPIMRIPLSDDVSDLLAVANGAVRDFNFNLAEDILKKAQNFDPTDRRPTVALGLLYFATGKSRPAEIELAKVAGSGRPFSTEVIFAEFLNRNLAEAESGLDSRSLDVLRSLRRNIAKELVSPLFPPSAALPTFTSDEPFSSPCNAADARSALDQWLKAWKARLFDRYIASYSDSYRGIYSTRNEWVAARKKAILTIKSLEISIERLTIDVKPNCNATLVFHQHYRAGNYADFGVKTLVMRLVGGQWLIVGENWSSLQR